MKHLVVLMLNMKHLVVMTHFLKSISILNMKANFLLYRVFSHFWLEYPIFLCKYETFRFSDYRRLAMNSNLVSWKIESNCPMGFNTIRDSGGNIFKIGV